MSGYTQDNKELLGHLKEQIAFMQESAISYDRGFESEAKRLAVVIRVLVHDTPQSTSLLTLLGRKRQMLFYDSASKYNPRNLATSNCLTVMKVSAEEAEYVAPLDDLSSGRDKNKKRSFNNWWKRLIIYKDNKNNTFTRSDLVLAAANTEGGAHVDPRLDQAYADLSRFNSLGWKLFVHGEEKDFNNTPILPSIRQIAHEVLRTLKDEFPDLF